jgi:dolichol-phosphate mannosyltransferase
MMLSVVIAAYNEEKNVGILTSRIIQVLDSHRIPFEILYVVEGEDGTLDVLKKIQKKERRLRIIYSKKPLGLGRAFKRGFMNISSKATHVLTLDSDLNHRPEEIPQFFDTMKKRKADVIIGSRSTSDRATGMFPGPKKIISLVTNALLSLVTNIQVKDKTSNYRLYTRRALDSIMDNMKFPGFESVVEMLWIAVKKKFRTAETPIHFEWRIHGESKLNFLTTGWGYAKLFMKLLK